jgi:hypothetical protein
MILITFIIFMIVIYALYKIYNDSETTFKPLDPNYNSEEMNKYINDVKDFVSEKVSVPKSVIDNMKAAENEEANKAKKILSDIPKSSYSYSGFGSGGGGGSSSDWSDSGSSSSYDSGSSDSGGSDD